MNQKFNTTNIIFSPEFLREGSALYDTLNPSRIVVGDRDERGRWIVNLMTSGILKKDIEVILTSSTEAEAIKLFSNAYLAMRVAFFNEVDTYAEVKGLNTREIINGICADPRIGDFYNNPSFGYGGYCLPKDTKQLAWHYSSIPNALVKAIIDSNSIRKDHITHMILEREPRAVGIYRLIAKSGSDNFRTSAIKGIIKRLQAKNIKVIIFEPELEDEIFYGAPVLKDLKEFESQADIIVANRNATALIGFKDKLYTRDIYYRD